MAAPGAGPDGGDTHELEVGDRPGSRDREYGPSHDAVAWRAAEALAPWSARMSWADGDRPEEVAVCELCGLVSRRPFPEVCPACGGGYG